MQSVVIYESVLVVIFNTAYAGCCSKPFLVYP